MQMNHPITVCK